MKDLDIEHHITENTGLEAYNQELGNVVKT